MLLQRLNNRQTNKSWLLIIEIKIILLSQLLSLQFCLIKFANYLKTTSFQDFKEKESMIIAATPTSATMGTFWSLVSEKNVSTVVIVTEPASPNYKVNNIVCISKTANGEICSNSKWFQKHIYIFICQRTKIPHDPFGWLTILYIV